jgi:hypothetical protein
MWGVAVKGMLLAELITALYPLHTVYVLPYKENTFVLRDYDYILAQFILRCYKASAKIYSFR